MGIFDERKAVTREKRLSTLSNFNGTLDALIEETSQSEIKQRVRTFGQAYADETIYAFNVLSTIEDAAIIVYGAIGCGAIGLNSEEKNTFNWYSTNMVEKDTILGGEDKLAEALKRAYEQLHPKAIFIVGTPIVAINNDDVNSIILEFEDELGIPVISIYTDGFKTKTPVNGYDIVTHSIAKYLISREDTDDKDDFINLISFSESVEDIYSITSILRDLNIKYNLIPQFSKIEDIKKASKAKVSVVLNSEEGEYLAESLENSFNVKYLKTDAPIGFRGTKSFIQKIAKEFGIENEAISYIEKQEELAKNKLEATLNDSTVFVEDSLTNLPGLVELIDLFGGEANGLAIPFVDISNRKYLQKLDGVSKGTTVIVGVGQYFEKSNALYKVHSDYYISRYSGNSFAYNEGSVPVSIDNIPYLGYAGVVAFAKALKKAKNVHDKYDASHVKSKYKESFRKKSGNWYVKQEVK